MLVGSQAGALRIEAFSQNYRTCQVAGKATNTVRSQSAGASLMSDDPVDQGERFFRELADNASVMIWRSGPDKLCDWFYKSWLGRGRAPR
jgi:hypothetical protein